MRPTREETYMSMAHILSMRSTCARRAVGCILADKHGAILGLGYNGVPSGWDHCIEVHCGGQDLPTGEGLSRCWAIHAEQNALLRCKDPTAIDMAVVTTMPCIHCQKLLLNTPCKTIYYSLPYVGPKVWNRKLVCLGVTDED